MQRKVCFYHIHYQYINNDCLKKQSLLDYDALPQQLQDARFHTLLTAAHRKNQHHIYWPPLLKISRGQPFTGSNFLKPLKKSTTSPFFPSRKHPDRRPQPPHCAFFNRDYHPLNPSSLARRAMGRTPFNGWRVPSSDSSPITHRTQSPLLSLSHLQQNTHSQREIV